MAEPTPHASLDLPPVEEIESVLDLEAEDRQEIPGLYNLNARRVPVARLVGMQVLLAFGALHNLVVGAGDGWSTFLVVAVGVELYAAAQFMVLRLLFARFTRIHLGTLFLALDLPVFTCVVYATGADASLLWPMYLIRVGDQLWIGRRRAALMGVIGAGSYVAMLLWVAGVERLPLDLGIEALKVGIILSLTGYMVSIARMPWDLQGRTRAAKDLILRLEQQSIELDEARRRAEEASQTKSEFLARMSHELRTPLNSVVGFTNLLLRKPETPTDRRLDYLDRIRQNGVHLLALINDILDIARIEEGRLDVHLTDVDVEVMVRDTVGQLQGRLQGTDVSISVAVPRRHRPIQADEARLRQILINLVGNAIKFTPSGWIRVEVAADEQTGRVERISVVDTGIGIGRSRQDGIFAAFEQADGSTARRFGGTGLGLAISRALCELMGFSLTVESALGEGSTFSVLIPEPAPENDEGATPL